ncbi:unnamed protein product [Soboliphyme baturini]|uniref:Uncharacterized protein n=1 Tax=Soboliphyme baturini TaxID=241478 RepID=A0A183I9R2_9BILA|nr:unnamed protein product [Soboliphyme baturini]
MDNPLFAQNRKEFHGIIVEVVKTVFFNRTVPLVRFYSDMSIKIAHEYEGLRIRHFIWSTFHFLKEVFMFWLKTGRVDL